MRAKKSYVPELAGKQQNPCFCVVNTSIDDCFEAESSLNCCSVWDPNEEEAEVWVPFQLFF